MDGEPVVAPGTFDGRVVWVTGASRGIGAAIAMRLAAKGAHLLLQARSAPALELVGSRIIDAGGQVEVVVGSVADPAVADAAVQLAVSRWGSIDALVNNAGISPVMVRSESLSLVDWRQIIDTNLTGAFVVARAAGAQMLLQGAGNIVNVSSVHGSTAAVRMLAYAASKGGIDMLTRTLGVEWAARGVRVNAIAPGYVETEMTEGLRAHERLSAELLTKIPMGHFAAVDDLFGAVEFLLSDASRYITGSILNIDGGWAAQ